MTTRWPVRRSAFAAWLPMYPAPPVTRTTGRSAAANGVVREPALLHLVGCEEVAAIEDHRRPHQRTHPLEIRPAEFVPLGHDGEAVGALERIVVARRVGDLRAEHAARD